MDLSIDVSLKNGNGNTGNPPPAVTLPARENIATDARSGDDTCSDDYGGFGDYMADGPPTSSTPGADGNANTADERQNTVTPATIVRLPVRQLHPNAFNPNRKPPAEFEQQKAESRRLGHLTKPIVVRLRSDGQYEVVDGEHGWRIAVELNWEEVDCEIVQADNFEAMRQCYTRNRSGTDNPVLLGKMFRQMQAERGMSARGLAKTLGISEGTIRNSQQYVQAAELRSSYAGHDCTDEVAELTTREINVYLSLGTELRDRWFDAGAGLFRIEPESTLPLRGTGLSHIVEPTLRGFRRSLDFALKLADWRAAHCSIQGVDDFIKPVAELRLDADYPYLPPTLLDLLPCHVEDGCTSVALPAEKWAAILTNVAQQTSSAKGIEALVETAVRVTLRNAGIDPNSLGDPRVAEALQIIQNGPAFISTAEFLTVAEKAELTIAEANAPADVVLRAKEMVCEHLCRKRANPGSKGLQAEGISLKGSIADMFQACVQKLLLEQQEAKQEALFADREGLFQVVLDRLAKSAAIHDGIVDDRPACDILAERLRSLPQPEFVLLAAAMLGSQAVDSAARRWLASIERMKS